MSEVKHNDIAAVRDFAVKKAEELKRGQDNLAAEYDRKLNDVLDTIDNIKVEQKKALISSKASDVYGESAERKAFSKYLKGGEKNLTPDEAKALSTFNDQQAGYLIAPPEYVTELNKLVTEISPVRAVSRVLPLNGKSLILPKVDANLSASWTAELAEKDETAPTFGQDEINYHEMSAYVEVSYRMQDDSAFNMESVLNEQFAEQFALAEGTAFILGNGVSRPFGITTSADINTAKTNTTTTISVDGLMNAVYSLKAVYRRNSGWMANRLTYREIRKLLASNSGSELLWAPTLRDGQPDLLLGYPVYEAPDLVAPNELTGAFTTSDIAALFGDFRRGYAIADRMEMRVIRDDVSKARSGRIAFTAMRYVGGKVVRGEAITKLVVTNS
jgi:HK97 family phage major capsid protein